MDLASLKMTFQRCVVKLKEVHGDGGIDWPNKCRILNRDLLQYFKDEDCLDTMEGFCRLLIHFHKYGTDNVSGPHLASRVLEAFHEFVTSNWLSDEEVDNILETRPSSELFEKALNAVVEFSSKKQLVKVEEVFRLRSDEKFATLVALVEGMLEKGGIVKAVEWICHFNLRSRDPFDERTNEHTTLFKEIVCSLLLLNRIDLLDDFVGSELFRQKELVRYLDKLVGSLLSGFVGNTPMETKLLDSDKKAEKAAKRYFEKFRLEEDMIPNLLNLRCKDALMYHYYRRNKGEMTHESFEEIALEAMKKSYLVRNYIVAYLSGQREERDKRLALYFAIHTNMERKGYKYPKDLEDFIEGHPGVVEETRREVYRSLMEKNQQLEAASTEKNYLFEKYPIIMVEDQRGLDQASQRILEEKVVGVDTEWKPSFESMHEQLAIMQVATSSEIFILDVFILEKRVANKTWLEFFEVLLCSKTRKIGFALHNDFRVIKRHFPFVAEGLAAKVKNVIDLRNLLSEVNDIPIAKKLVFEGRSGMLMGNNLHDVAKVFANITLNKDEREGNWLRRPLSKEQMEYAALDAYCLIKCFNEISTRLMQLEDTAVRQKLREASTVNFKPDANESVDGRNSRCRRTKGAEGDPMGFVATVQDVSREIEASGEPVRRVEEFKLVVDSMFFGVGEKLRKCGFDVRLIGNRIHLVNFCLSNPEFIVISTGKAFKEIQVQLPAGRCFHVQVNNDVGGSDSRVIASVCRQLNVAIRPEDMFSRCQKCNQRSTITRIPRRIFKVLFLDWVGFNKCDWMVPDLKMVEQDLQLAVQELYAHALPSSSSAFSGDDDYTIDVRENTITCQCKDCSIDLTNLLLLHNKHVSPVQIKMTKWLKKSLFDKEDARFEVCVQCGQLNKRLE